jgi:hypothetical protein
LKEQEESCEEDSERTAVTARCRNEERSGACGVAAKGKATRDDCISEGRSKVFEVLEGGAAARKAGRRKLNVFARWAIQIWIWKGISVRAW